MNLDKLDSRVEGYITQAGWRGVITLCRRHWLVVPHPALIEALLSDSQTLPEEEHVVILCQNLQGLRSRKRNCGTGENTFS